MKREYVEVNLSELTPAPWNPRKPITEESVATLAKDIAEKGLLHNIGVWINPANGEKVIAYGNRRAVAMRVAGMDKALALVFSDCEEIEARDMTRRENEFRLGVDPIMDSQLLASMRKMGKTEEEIADHYMIPVARVCRRLKLVDLAPDVKDWIEKGADISTDALERLSAYPSDIQIDVVNGVLKCKDFSHTFTWNDFRYSVINRTLDLDNGRSFDECAKCPLRTGATPDLFGDVGDNGLGRCLHPECHKRHEDERIRQMVDAKIDKSVTERVPLKYTYNMTSNGAIKDHPDEKNTCAYWAIGFDGEVVVKYGPSAAAKKERAKKEKERIAAENKKRLESEAAREAVRKKIASWCKSHMDGEIRKYVGSDPLKVIDVIIRFNCSYSSWQYDYDKTWKEWSKKRTIDNLFKVYVKDFFRRFQNIGADDAVRVFTFFKDVKWSTVLTKDDIKLIKSKDFLK